MERKKQVAVRTTTSVKLKCQIIIFEWIEYDTIQYFSKRYVNCLCFSESEFRPPEKRDSAVVILQRTHSSKTSDEQLFDRLFRLFDMNGEYSDE